MKKKWISIRYRSNVEIRSVLIQDNGHKIYVKISDVCGYNGETMLTVNRAMQSK